MLYTLNESLPPANKRLWQNTHTCRQRMELRSAWEGAIGAAVSAQRWRKALERIHTASMEVDLKQFKAPNGPALIQNQSGPMSAKETAP